MSKGTQLLTPHEIVGALRNELQREFGQVGEMPLRMLLLIEQLREAERNSSLTPAQ